MRFLEIIVGSCFSVSGSTPDQERLEVILLFLPLTLPTIRSAARGANLEGYCADKLFLDDSKKQLPNKKSITTASIKFGFGLRVVMPFVNSYRS